ncbi:unnamed protein product [Thelazia callipaeda]|uniref:Origin recognition complex subunit 2 n=1 Tax=Thelazia callipaeda TaxID=103827 RepID=A0A0N5CVF5_THECL|nr:unnamed protein product [Thelazia callipaeda]
MERAEIDDVTNEVLLCFEDEKNLSFNPVISNYFNQGNVARRKNRMNRKKKKTSKCNGSGEISDDDDDDDDENDEDSDKDSDDCRDFAKFDLVPLSNWFEVRMNISLQECDSYLPLDIIQQCASNENLFLRWSTFLAAGFNLILFGIGSKRDLLQSFCEKELCNHTYLIVDGFQRRINSHVIFKYLEKNLSLEVVQHNNHLEYADAIGSAIDSKREDVVLVLHNIDGPGLRTSFEQCALSKFGRAKYGHIIATVDHVNKSLLWSQKLLNAFNFLFINVNTMKTYKAEVYASCSKLLRLYPKDSRHTHTSASLDVVWVSLTTNSRSLLHLIARNYYSKKKPLEFFELLCSARNYFLVSTDAALRQHLNEYSDHHLILCKRHSDGNEYISMAVDEEVCHFDYLETNSNLMHCQSRH